jgi:transcription antitermination factor NusB
VPWWVTTGTTSFGSGTEEAFQNDATYEEAGTYGAISAGADILTEKLSGGISFGGKTLDDVWLKPLTNKITNKTVQTLTKYGLDVVGEGGEEVLASVMQNLGKKLTYEDEKTLWKKIYGSLLIGSEDLSSALEEMELALDQEGWTTDVDMVLTYIVKTLKRMREDMTDELPLLEMFSSEEELTFAKNLLQWSLDQAEENSELIAGALQNWESDRVAYMDHIILLVALAEIRQSNDIALEISMNEYIEISKEYSSEKSYVFVNGVLNKIVKDLKAANKLFKVVR